MEEKVTTFVTREVIYDRHGKHFINIKFESREHAIAWLRGSAEQADGFDTDGCTLIVPVK